MNDPQHNPLSKGQHILENVEPQVIRSDVTYEVGNTAATSFFTVSSSTDIHGHPVNRLDWSPRPYIKLIRIEQKTRIVITLIDGYHSQYPPYYDTHVSYGVTYQYELIGPGNNVPPRYTPLVTPEPLPNKPVVDLFPKVDEGERFAEVERRIDETQLNVQLPDLPAEKLAE
ncbi:MAG TPA: hypothetical protein VL485_32665 [Ktedonobacteraceae bacterium]|jgi:hypothetical protein|nr:hypothetical protein [Ktedonobacteraceae bacterium]